MEEVQMDKDTTNLVNESHGWSRDTISLHDRNNRFD